MTDTEYQDLVTLYSLDTARASSKAAYRVLVGGETYADAARNENCNYHTALHSIQGLQLKYQLYLGVKRRIIEEAAQSKS